jgi:hypothetical protein
LELIEIAVLGKIYMTLRVDGVRELEQLEQQEAHRAASEHRT